MLTYEIKHGYFQLISKNEISTDTVLLEVSQLLKQINFLTKEYYTASKLLSTDCLLTMRG